MRCLHVVNVRWLNATAWYGLYSAKLLAEAGHPTSIVSIPGAPALKKAQEWGLQTFTLDLNASNPLKLLGLYRSMRRLVKETRPHVVNCFRGENFAQWAALRKQTGRFALVRTRGDRRPAKAGPANRWLHRSAADAVAATNSAIAQECREKLKVPDRKLWTDPGGVDTNVFAFDPKGRFSVRREFGYGQEHVVIGLLGRLDHVKGQMEAIDALSMLHAVGATNARLLLMGHDSVLCGCETRSRALQRNMQDFVTITGKREDIPACLSACDLCIVPSLGSEAIARAALEIMACGRPLLASRVGVLPDLVPEDGLFAPGDVKALAKTLHRAITDQAYIDSITWDEQGRIGRYSGREFLRRTIAMYEKMLEGVPRAGEA